MSNQDFKVLPFKGRELEPTGSLADEAFAPRAVETPLSEALRIFLETGDLGVVRDANEMFGIPSAQARALRDGTIPKVPDAVTVEVEDVRTGGEVIPITVGRHSKPKSAA